MSRATIKQLLTGGASLMQRSASSAGSQPNAVAPSRRTGCGALRFVSVGDRGRLGRLS